MTKQTRKALCTKCLNPRGTTGPQRPIAMASAVVIAGLSLAAGSVQATATKASFKVQSKQSLRKGGA